MSQIDEVKQATDIIQLIGERLQLQRSGSNWRGLCPFHSEKSPSFFVSEPMQRYKCFGCGESGDVFTFLQKYEAMTFGEAIKMLADRAGITLKDYAPTQEDDSKERLLQILNLAKEYYHFVLTKHEVGEPARQYLKARGTTQESIKLFQLGYSQESWDGLLKYLRDKKKFSEAEIEKTGLLVRSKGGRVYDRFRGRVMFPLTNHRGQVVGFSGRVLDAAAKEAKYINTPETLLYHKSQMLFGYSELFQEIRKKREVVVVEGEFDVISSAQAHLNTVVAIKGSALTTDHVKLLGRVVDRVILSLDQDAAGVEATKRAIAIIKDTPLELRVVNLRAVLAQLKAEQPDLDVSKLDPDMVARQFPGLWRDAVKGSISAYEFFLQAALAQYDISTPEGKRDIMTELGPVLHGIPLVIEQDVYIKKLAQALGVKEEVVRTDMKRVVGRQASRKTARPAAGRATTTPDSSEPEAKPVVPLTRRQKLEEYVLFLLCRMPLPELSARLTDLESVSWSVVGVRQALDHLAQLVARASASTTMAQLIAQLDQDLQLVLANASLNPEFEQLSAQTDLDKEWQQTLKELNVEQTRAHIAELEQELAELERFAELDATQEARQTQLLRQLVELQQRLRPAH